jgi:hypothetical protein
MMKRADFRRVIRNAGELFGIDDNLLVALASIKGWVDDIDLINSVYTAAAQLRHKLNIFATYENAIRAYHSGVNPADWSQETEAFVRHVDELVNQVKAARNAAPDAATENATEPLAGESERAN